MVNGEDPNANRKKKGKEYGMGDGDGDEQPVLQADPQWIKDLPPVVHDE